MTQRDIAHTALPGKSWPAAASRHRPVLTCDAAPMWCPYCGYEMREGFVRLRGQWAGVLAVNFEAGDGSGEGSELLPRTLFRSHERAAHCCVRCEAVLVEPKSGTYVPPGEDAAGAARAGSGTTAAARGEAADGSASADEARPEAPADRPGEAANGSAGAQLPAEAETTARPEPAPPADAGGEGPVEPGDRDDAEVAGNGHAPGG